MAPSEVGKVERICCPACKGETNHTILHSIERVWIHAVYDDCEVASGIISDFMRCNGCETATLRLQGWYSEEGGHSETYYPPRGTDQSYREEKLLRFMERGPLHTVYRETIEAFNRDSLTLAGSGIRLIIEGVSNDRGVKDGPLLNHDGTSRLKDNGDPLRANTLEGKINGMAEKGIITTFQAQILHQLRFLGNSVAHELTKPRKDELNFALDIVEHVFEQVYEQPEKASLLPQRPGGTPKNTN